jgi:Chaperone of endosialidase
LLGIRLRHRNPLYDFFYCRAESKAAESRAMKSNTLSLISFALLTYFASSLGVEAVIPVPDGCYLNFTTAEGCDALNSVSTGSGNTAIGYRSLFLDSSASFNTGVGVGALALNNGNNNTALGAVALLLNTTGIENTAVGANALFSNNGGIFNNAVGSYALYSNLDGYGNNAFGEAALGANVSGSLNTAIGHNALNNDNGNDMGIGNNNTAVEGFALFSNESGSSNTALGNGALNFCTTGSFNVAIGEYAGTTNVPSTGSFNVAIGDSAGSAVVTGSNIICIGAEVSGEDVSDTTWIANVYGVTTQSGTTAPVVVSDTGQLGTVASSERFKKDIATMEKASEAILALRPVTFHYKTDTKAMPQFGLVAEEVAKVNPALVLPDKEGKPYTVRYDAVNAMLLNEFLKEHRHVQEQDAIIAKQQKQIEALSAGLQKVNAQLELTKAAPQTVSNVSRNR